METEYKQLSELTGIVFNDISLFKTAFTHKSYLNENRNSVKEHNERMEFLGDAVLELITTNFLYKKYEEAEGILTNWRSALVKKETLAGLARSLNLGDYLFLSKGEEATGGRDKDYILANTFEAFLGALYLDQDYKVVETFVVERLEPLLAKILETGKHIDSKSHFQEVAQELTSITPNYRVLKEEGPDHAKIFTMGAYLNEELIGQGEGSNKQSAEQAAAADAIEKKGWK